MSQWLTQGESETDNVIIGTVKVEITGVTGKSGSGFRVMLVSGLRLWLGLRAHKFEKKFYDNLHIYTTMIWLIDSRSYRLQLVN